MNIVDVHGEPLNLSLQESFNGAGNIVRIFNTLGTNVS